MRRPRRTALALGSAAVLLAGCGASEELPEITYHADGTTVVGGPVVYCSLDFTDCAAPGPATRLEVPAGSVLQMSLPGEIFDAPWRLLVVYLDREGETQVRDDYFGPGDRHTATIDLGDDGSLLQFAEVQLPSGATDADDNPVARAAWSLQNSLVPAE